MKNEIMVSIAMITYNHERFIVKALDSIFMQETNFNIEVIIGEDCSKDNTRKILQEYVKRYPIQIKPLYREHNLGMTRNAIDVIKHCSGKYIAFLEGDDIWTDSKKLQKQVDFLECHPYHSATAHECNVIDQIGNEIGGKLDIHHLCNGEYLLENVEKNEMPGQTATVMIRNFEKNELDKIIKKVRWALIPLDRILPLILLSMGKIFVFDEIMSSYRYYIEENGTNWTSTHDISYKRNYLSYFLYSLIEEKIANQFHLNIDKLNYRAQLFVQSYRTAKRGGKKKCLIQSLIMFFLEFHKIRYYRAIMEYKNTHNY